MSRVDAVDKMKKGYKCRMVHWGAGEYVMFDIVDGFVKTQDGKQFTSVRITDVYTAGGKFPEVWEIVE